jgi:hypothetical protein
MRLLVALAVFCGLSLSSPTAADAATVVKLELNGHTITVTTSTGHELRLAVAAFKDITEGDASKAQINVTLSTGKAVSFGETHRWSFAAKRSAFTFHKKSGNASLVTDAALGDFGSLDLAFQKGHREFEQCSGGGTETTYVGTLSGAVHFRSQTGWGRVSKKHLSFTSNNEVVVDASCEEAEGAGEEEEAVCHQSTSWVGPTATLPNGLTTQYGSAFVSGGPKRPSITASRTVSLLSPHGAGRADYLVAESPPPQLDTGSNTLTITTKAGTAISGGATISGGQQTPPATSDCHDEATNTDRTETTTGYFGASWSSAADGPLHVNFAVTPDFNAPTSGSASWSQSSFS